jgi:threonine synthase
LGTSLLTGLRCSRCSTEHDPGEPQRTCGQCDSPLLAFYDLNRLREADLRAQLEQRPWTLWRYRELLPLSESDQPVTLGERVTPLIESKALSDWVGLSRLQVKDEGTLPTGSFKARGAAVGITRARALGMTRIALASAGNAGAAWAAYGARAGLEVLVTMPDDAPAANQAEVRATGAQLRLVTGTISDAGRALQPFLSQGFFPVTTFREPYRVEGKKTIAFELAEQLGWRWPSAIIYPTGGAVGLIGIWKAAQELAEIGWVQPPLPRLVAVQSTTCAPIVAAFEAGADATGPIKNPATVAPGIRVPDPFAGPLALRAIRETNGTAIAVSDSEILDAMRRASRLSGIFFGPEGGATVAAARRLREDGWLSEADDVVLLNTGSGLKHLDLFDA